MKTLKEFKKEIKRAGYRVKTEVIGRYRRLEILDKEGNFVVGSGANVYPQERIDKHPEAFRLVRENKDQVFDEDGDKVLF